MNPQSSAMDNADAPVYLGFTPSSRLSSTHPETLPPDQSTCVDSGNVYPSPITPTRPVVQTNQRFSTVVFSHDSCASCLCLQTVISLLEKLENEGDLMDSSALDSILAFHKDALAQCGILLRCLSCMARSEYPLILILVCEKLVSFCEKMMNEYLRRSGGQIDCLFGKENERQEKFSFGKYELDLPVELDLFFGVLMNLQLKALEMLLAEVRETVSLSLHGARLSKFLNNERRLEALAEKLQRPEIRARPQHRASSCRNE